VFVVVEANLATVAGTSLTTITHEGVDVLACRRRSQKVASKDFRQKEMSKEVPKTEMQGRDM
jgi:hypothetical protein